MPTKKELTQVNQLLDEACKLATSRNKLCGHLDVTTQQFENFRRKSEVSLPCAIKLSYMTGHPWESFAPKHAEQLKDLPKF